MSERHELSGSYIIKNDAHIRRKSEDESDPRHVFYRAMLDCGTFESYTAETRGHIATTGDRVADSTTGRDEILYALRNQWIEKA